MPAEVTFLGTGTSFGVPYPLCDCVTCSLSDPKDKYNERSRRLRTSAVVKSDGLTILVDCGPDFRKQALRAGLTRVDVVLVTHHHADHIHGLLDLLELVERRGVMVPLFANVPTAASIRQSFPELCDNPVMPICTELNCGAFDVLHGHGVRIVPIPVLHGDLPIYGYRIGDFGYVTDASFMSPESRQLLDGVSVLVMVGLRGEPFPTHWSLRESLVEMLALRPRPRRFFWTHLSHHDSLRRVKEIAKQLREELEVDGSLRFGPAWDGLVVEV